MYNLYRDRTFISNLQSMSPEKQIRSFRKLIARDEALTDKIRQVGTFDELAVLMAKFGCMVKASELAEHAETLILLKTQKLEETTPNYKEESLERRGLLRGFLAKRRAQKVFWENEMARLRYYSPEPNYDAFSKFQEKGG